MKCYSHVKILIVLFHICLVMIRSTRTRSRNKHKNIKTGLIKNGPILWNSFTNDQVLDKLLKDERTNNNNNNIAQPNYNYNRIYNNSVNNFKQNETPVFLGGKTALSENQKSPTFTPVGPRHDSTVNFQGKKYSQMFRHINKRTIKPGFYGSSRLTRF